jgi:hypothetical protein
MHRTVKTQVYVRVMRCWHHARKPLTPSEFRLFVPRSLSAWAGDALCYLMDLFWVGECWHWLMRTLKRNHRNLTDSEIDLARQLFGDAIDYSKVWVDQRSLLAAHHSIEAFVSFNCINYRNAISDAVFLHEMVHIWQYQRFGSIYIALAWRAHRRENVYDYGGPYALYKEMLRGSLFTSFSVEQQAEIVEDYYRLYQGHPQETDLTAQAYIYFIRQLQD